MTNELEHTPEAESIEDTSIEYGSSRYWDELYVPDGKLPPEIEVGATQKALKKYLGEQDTKTAETIAKYLAHARVRPYAEIVARQDGVEFSTVLRSAMLRLMDTMQDMNGREEGLFIAKELEKISLKEQYLRREAYNTLHPSI